MAQAIASRARKAVVKALESECWQLREGARRYLGQRKVVRPSIVNKRSSDILHDPWYNKVRSTDKSRLIPIDDEFVLCHGASRPFSVHAWAKSFAKEREIQN